MTGANAATTTTTAEESSSIQTNDDVDVTEQDDSNQRSSSPSVLSNNNSIFTDLNNKQIVKLFMHIGLQRHRTAIENNLDNLFGYMLDDITSLESYITFLETNFTCKVNEYLAKETFRKLMKIKSLRSLPNAVKYTSLYDDLTRDEMILLLTNIGIPNIRHAMETNGQHVQSYFLSQIESDEDYTSLLTHVKCILDPKDIVFRATFNKLMELKEDPEGLKAMLLINQQQQPLPIINDE